MDSSDNEWDSDYDKESFSASSKKQGKKKRIHDQNGFKEMQDSQEQGADNNATGKNRNIVLYMKVDEEEAIHRPNEFGSIDNAKPSTSREKDFQDDDSSQRRMFDNHVNNFKSVTQSSNRKRTVDNEPGTCSERHRKIASNDVPQQKGEIISTRGLIYEETYDASGLKGSLHGMVYQLKHLMLIVHRVSKTGYTFRLATEMDKAEKFDDIVLHYQDKSGDQMHRFVQLKHKQDGTKKISANHLLDEKDSEFSVLKYFVSWRKIKKYSDFGGSTSKNFILLTNIGLDVKGLEEANIGISAVRESDNFLKITNRTEQPPRYKLVADKRSRLYDTLKLASDLHRLARELAERVCGSKDIQLNTDIIKSYHVALAEEVVDIDTKTISINFIMNHGLSGKAEKFREVFFLYVKRLLPGRNLSEEDIWKHLGDCSLKLSLTFGKKLQLANEIELTSLTRLPEDHIDDVEISQFLDEFILAVNQPNEVELGEMMKHEIGADSRFNLLDRGFIRDSFQNAILDWFKNKQGKFLKNNDTEHFFNKIESKLCSLITMALSSEYSEKLKELGIEFNYEDTDLVNFINGPDCTSSQILKVTCSAKTLLTALHVHQTLVQSKKCKRNENFIFIRLETLLVPKIMKQVLGAFGSPRHHNLLVVDCESISVKQYLQKLWNLLCEIIEKNVRKKMIVITQKGYDLGTEFRLGHLTCCEKNRDYSFRNLSYASQKMLLEKPVTRFQGQINITSFGELLGIRDSDNITADDLEDLSEIIDSDSLVELICRDEIRIGGDLEEMGEISDYYINRKIHRHIVIEGNILKDQQIPDLLAISGIDTESLDELMQMGEILTMDGKLRNFTILCDRQEEEEFKTLCAKNVQRNIHWLRKESGKYVWKQSQGDITYLVKYRDVIKTDDNKVRPGGIYLNENQLAAHYEPVIISDMAGMGKSTMLTYLAWKIKENDPDMLVLKIDLNYHATALEKVTKQSNYNLCSIKEAVQFLLKELLSRETNLARKVFKRIIEKQGGVALIFDGFDEISPTYEGTVIDLLQAFVNHGIKKLFVATRPHTREALECKLNAFSYEIQSLSSGDQEEFLTKFWKTKLGSHRDSEQETENRIKIYAAAIIKKLADSIEDQRNKFTSIPLQARLVAEIFENHSEEKREDFDSCKRFIDSQVDRPKFPDKINLIYLYEHFVDKKFAIFFNKTGGCLENEALKEFRKLRYDNFIDSHQKFALDTLFGKEKLRELLPPQQDVSHHLDIVVERTGIISEFIDGQPHFAHRTYAEYFAAKYLSDRLKKGEVNQSFRGYFVADILLRKKYQTVRVFVNLLLSDEHKKALDSESWKFFLNEHRSKLNETIFHVAAVEGNWNIIRLFLNCLGTNLEDRAVFINLRDNSNRTVVHRAVKSRNMDGIKLLVEDTSFKIESVETIERTPLHIAAQAGNLEVVKYLLDKGANVNSVTMHNCTPLHEAARYGQFEVMKYLLDKGAKINFLTIHNSTPLHEAVRYGQLEVVKYLLDKSADVNSQENTGCTPLHIAIREGKLDSVKYLLDKGADVNSQENTGCTPLHIATREGKLDVVKHLLDKGANVNSLTMQSCTPLYEAIRHDQFEVVKYLLEKGAKVNRLTMYSCTPLHAAVRHGQLEVVKYLLNKGADVNSQENIDCAPLHIATQEGRLDAVKYLLANGADINSLTMRGCMPLHEAARYGQLEIVKHLLKEKANVNSLTTSGCTPLHEAARHGQLEVVEYLLDNGANANSLTMHNYTPLHEAVRYGQLEVVKYLLETEANIRSRDNHVITLPDVLALAGKLDVVDFFKHPRWHIELLRKLDRWLDQWS